MTTRNMQTITIKTTKGDTKIDAYVFGDWAAHPTWVHDTDVVPPHLALALYSWWRVTYVPLGLCLPPLVQEHSVTVAGVVGTGPLTEQEAIIAAQYINARLNGMEPQRGDINWACAVDALLAESMDEEGL